MKSTAAHYGPGHPPQAHPESCRVASYRDSRFGLLGPTTRLGIFCVKLGLTFNVAVGLAEVEHRGRGYGPQDYG